MAQRQFRSDDTDIWMDGFGDGHSGALTISSNTNTSSFVAMIEVTGTNLQGSTSLTVNATNGLNTGDAILIHQARGTGYGGWELNRITGGGGTGTLTLKYPLTQDYVDDGGVRQAHVQQLHEYSGVTVNSGVTLTGRAWDGVKGGMIAFLCNGTVTINGTLDVQGAKGGFGSCDCTVAAGATGGFIGGHGDQQVGDSNGQGGSGEGTTTMPLQNIANTAGSGGGAGAGRAAATGAGGGHAIAGNNGTNNGGSGSSIGIGGLAVGNASLTSLNFGGGGAGGTDNPNNGVGAGGSGGGAIVIIAKDIVFSSTGYATVRGGDGGGPTKWGGGGGAGGSILFKCETIDINTNKIDCSGSLAGSGSSGSGGAGGYGRAHADYSISLGGSTNLPSIDTTLDPTIIPYRPREDSYTLLL